VQLSLAALVAVPKMPLETLSWLASPDTAKTVDTGADLPGLANFDLLPFASAVSDTFLGIVGVTGLHELGHQIVAKLRSIKLGPILLVPNGSLGTFGAVTRSQSVLKDRGQLWELAASGPVLGLLGAAALFARGLQVCRDRSLVVTPRKPGTSGQAMRMLNLPLPAALLACGHRCTATVHSFLCFFLLFSLFRVSASTRLPSCGTAR
jgi:hypothetical protein